MAGRSKFCASVFYLRNSIFTFCGYVRFFNLQRQADAWCEEAYAADPADWSRTCAKMACDLSLRRRSFGEEDIDNAFR
jgi:hypothetical protein